MKFHYVVKIGGSVLLDDSSYSRQAQRIIDFSQDKERVYVVLSARKGQTNQLVNSLCQSTEEVLSLNRLLQENDYSRQLDIDLFDNPAVASHLLGGEIESTLRFEKELKNQGVYPQTLVQGVNFPIIANGCYLNAAVDMGSSIETDVLSQLEDQIILVPGFGAQNHYQEKVLLGRNASDYVASLIGRLDPQVNEIIYLKDVDGVYENYNTPQQRLIKEIRTSELFERGFSQILDARCLKDNLCNIRVQNCQSTIGQGGTLIN